MTEKIVAVVTGASRGIGKACAIELAKANCEKFKYFVTLTFADIKEKEKHIRLNNSRLEDDEELWFFQRLIKELI